MKHERFELNELDYNKFREILELIHIRSTVCVTVYEDGICWHYVFEDGRLEDYSKADVRTYSVYGKQVSNTLYTEEDRFKDGVEISYTM